MGSRSKGGGSSEISFRGFPTATAMPWGYGFGGDDREFEYKVDIAPPGGSRVCNRKECARNVIPEGCPRWMSKDGLVENFYCLRPKCLAYTSVKNALGSGVCRGPGGVAALQGGHMVRVDSLPTTAPFGSQISYPHCTLIASPSNSTTRAPCVGSISLNSHRRAIAVRRVHPGRQRAPRQQERHCHRTPPGHRHGAKHQGLHRRSPGLVRCPLPSPALP